jgi:hypothetical protein
LTDEVEVLGVVFLDFSPVAGSLEAVSSVQLSLEESDVLLLDGVDIFENVPVNIGGARWSGERSLVDESVLAVNHVQEVSDGHKVNGWALDRSVIKLHGFEESVDHSGFSPGQLGSGRLDGEKDTDHSGIEVVILSVSWGVDNLELQVFSISVDGVLGASSDIHVGTSPLVVGTEELLAEHGLEAEVDQFVIFDLGVQLDRLSIENPSDVFTIGVYSFGIVVLPIMDFVVCHSLLEKVFPGLSAVQVDWRLVGTSTLVVSDVKISPVGTVGGVVPFLCGDEGEKQ